MTKFENKADARLLVAASFVRQDAVVADVGSDHAYLPIYLVQNCIALRAVASDINEGPIENARANVNEAGLSDKIETVLVDGLAGIEKYAPTDILICGMGGELIAKIINEAPFTRDKRIRLILQPMTKQEKLRAYLIKAGYEIVSEKLCFEGGKIYQCMCAEYDGVPRTYSEAELLLGRHNIEEKSELFFKLVSQKTAALEKSIAGKKEAGIDAAKEKRLFAELVSMKGQDV